MKTLQLIQGSPAWHEHRAKHFNASDAPAMLGISSYKSRRDLLREKATGYAPEVDRATQERFNDGHRYEAIARPWAEEIIGEELYPVVLADEIDGLPLSASLDGLTMLEEIAFEHKTLNAALTDNLINGVIPDEHHPQIAQQLLTPGATRRLRMASNGGRDTLHSARYDSNAEVREHLLAG